MSALCLNIMLQVLHSLVICSPHSTNGGPQEIGFVIQVWLKYYGYNYGHCINQMV